ncbi:MAG TPA: alpha amylase N-terminal ig-like domain-containing protein, partial [Fimbriimonadaceae bacterium]|nr:alpha amylase N-terminal ig-like domain-containing protein [Fimbriimonadaceae bacterium]
MFAAFLALAAFQSVAVRPVTFSHTPTAGTSSVAVVGGFNNWDRAAHPLVRQADRKTWRGTFDIAPGIYPYLFVEDGKRWVPDPKAPPFPDLNGNTNSKLIVLPLDYDAQPAARGDRLVTASALRHRPNPADTVRMSQREASLGLRTRRGDVGQVEVMLGDGSSHRMRRIDGDELYDEWRGRVPVGQGEQRYRFRLDGAIT